MDEPRRVHGRQRATEIQSDEGGLTRRKRPVLAEHLLQREPADELHPQPDLTARRFGAVDGDDVGMGDARKQPTFGKNL